MVLNEKWLGQVKKNLPMMREERKKLFQETYGLTEYDASVLTASVYMAERFERTVKLTGNGRKTAAWLMGETMRLMKEEGVEPQDLKFSSEHLASLIQMEEKGIVTAHSARKVFAAMFREDTDPEQYIREHGLAVVRDEQELEKAVSGVLAEYGQAVEEYRQGKDKVFSFLMGQVMRQMKGKADPDSIRKLLSEKLNQ